MSMRNWAVLGLILGMAMTAHAEWGSGLGNEFKTILIPQQQQSGWGLRTDGEIKPMAQAAKAPVAAAPVAASPSKPTAAVAAAPEAVKAVPQDKWVLSGVQFETNSDKLKSESKGVLDDAAKTLKKHDRVVVEIQGYTDNTGDAAYNEQLSQKRALAVKNYMTEQGVQSTRLEAKGYGQASPIADNSTAAGRAQNRRIEFKVLQR